MAELAGDKMSITVIPTTCTECGKKVDCYYPKGFQWWDKYVDADQELCLDCIKKKAGFTKDFERNVGIKLSDFLEAK